MGLWHLRATIEYDGTDFSGFQVQADRRSVQGELEAALLSIIPEHSRVVGAGRTDAGVHASGQVVGFTVDWAHPLEDLKRALNAMLPADVAVRELEEAEASFHARRSAKSREYRYTILNQPVRSPLARRYAYHLTEELDLERMAQAAQELKGWHDFAAFGSSPSGGSTVREVKEVNIARQESYVPLDIRANAFLYHMVRSIVGTLVKVGLGRLNPEEFREILEARDPNRAGPVLPACGLCLTRVNY